MTPVPNQAFDQHHPPAPELINQCVHCGFCLPACPTYVLWGNEMDSPRGRIYLMKMASDGATAMTDPWVRHIDTCLGCMSCMTACPSGVDYAKLIEATLKGPPLIDHTDSPHPLVRRRFKQRPNLGATDQE